MVWSGSSPPSAPTGWPAANTGREPTEIRVGDVVIGGDEVVMMSGPCSVESRDLLIEAAIHAQKAGATILRGGAFKPRTSPYSFQGMAEDGLKILAEARDLTGMPVITEVMSSETVPLVSEYADILQIGTRNMQNFHLLFAAGRQPKPVLLKRGMMSTIEELLLSAEYIMSQGNTDVILCERGIRTFETATRNTLDLNAIPVLKELSHLPVVVDPSHATGRRSLVPAMARGCHRQWGGWAAHRDAPEPRAGPLRRRPVGDPGSALQPGRGVPPGGGGHRPHPLTR